MATETVVTVDDEGKDIEVVLGQLGLNATYTGGTVAPQMYRFDFVVNGTPTVSMIKKTVERLRVHFGKYEYADTPNGKGFSIIRPKAKPTTINFAQANSKMVDTVKADENGRQKCYLYFGRDTYGNDIIRSIDDCKSMLVAGMAGSGKSCFLNSLIIQIMLYSNASLILIDPKDGAEFGIYEKDIHYRIRAVAKDTKEAVKQLKEAFDIMQARYAEMGQDYQKKYTGKRLIVVIDELAELMEENKEEIEPLVRRIAAKGRAAGVHLIVATQDPRASVVTGLIKYNLQTKICLKTANARHSMNVMDKGDGANLLGRGDAYIKFEDTTAFLRVQTPYISDEQIIKLITT